MTHAWYLDVTDTLDKRGSAKTRASWSLPRSFWPHDVVVWVRSRPGECTTAPWEVDPKTIRVFQRPVTLSATQANDTPYHELTKAHSERRRADEAHSDGLRQQSKTTTTRSVGGRTDKP